MIVELVFVFTAVVVIVNVAVVAPAATEPDVGAVADAELDVIENGNPPLGAALVIVTVAVEGLPPTTDVGLRVMPLIVGAVIASVAV